MQVFDSVGRFDIEIFDDSDGGKAEVSVFCESSDFRFFATHCDGAGAIDSAEMEIEALIGELSGVLEKIRSAKVSQ